MEKAIVILILSVLSTISVVLASPNPVTTDSLGTSSEVESSAENSKILSEVDRGDQDEHDEDFENKFMNNSNQSVQTDLIKDLDHDGGDDNAEEPLEQEEIMQQIDNFEHEVYGEGFIPENDQDDENDKDDSDDDD
nr:expressed protein [Hymenolepis microstoma]